MTDQDLLDLFKQEVCDNDKTVDPDGEFQWFDLSIGFFLAKGCNIDRAVDLAAEARYTHEYWK